MQRAFSPILVLIILGLTITIGIFVSKNKTRQFETTPVETKVTMEASPSATPTQSAKPKAKQPSVNAYSPFPTPNTTSNPTVLQPISIINVNLGRSHSSMPEGASGNGVIKLMELAPYMSDDAKIASLQYDFNLRGMEPEKEYSISVCTILEGGDCVGLVTTSLIRTDKSGNVAVNGSSGVTLTKSRPFKAIKVTQRDGGFCSNSGSPCLRGEFYLEI